MGRKENALYFQEYLNIVINSGLRRRPGLVPPPHRHPLGYHQRRSPRGGARRRLRLLHLLRVLRAVPHHLERHSPVARRLPLRHLPRYLRFDG